MAEKKEVVVKPNFRVVTGPSTTMNRAFSDASMKASPQNIRTWHNLLRDHQVSSAWQQRQDGVISVDWEVIAGSEDSRDVAAAEFLKDQLTKIAFDQVTRKMHYAQMFGFAIAECLWAMEDSKVVLEAIKVRAQDRFSFKNGELLFTGGANPTGEPLAQNKMWYYSIPGASDDVPHGASLGWKLYWPVFLKENGAKFWAVALEKFGMPTAKGTHPSTATAEEINNLIQALMSIHSQSAVAFPDGFEAELMQAVRSSGGDYEKFQDYWDKAVSKIILSQTMTTDDGSSQSQANVHERVGDSVIQADADLICDSFNRGPVVWLTQWNFPGAKPPQVWRRISQAEDLGKRAERDKTISEATGKKLSQRYAEETYDIELDDTNTQEAPPATASSFADPGTIVDDIDALADQMDDLTSTEFADILDEIRQTLKASKSLEDAQDQLLLLSSKIKTDNMAKKVAGGLAVAELMGRASVNT
ncbi:MAG: DUF935 family protein [Methylocystaceae bacterium]|nr:DUF935 family protein [Methylocystaceae bacterium]